MDRVNNPVVELGGLARADTPASTSVLITSESHRWKVKVITVSPFSSNGLLVSSNRSFSVVCSECQKRSRDAAVEKDVGNLDRHRKKKPPKMTDFALDPNPGFYCARRFGAILGCSKQSVTVPRRNQQRVQTLVRFGWRATIPVTTIPNSERCDLPGGGAHLSEWRRSLRRTVLLDGHTRCPEILSNCPDVQVISVSGSSPRQDGPLQRQPSSGVTPLRHRQLAHLRHDSAAWENTLRGLRLTSNTDSTAHCPASAAEGTMPSMPSAPTACAASGCQPCKHPTDGHQMMLEW